MCCSRRCPVAPCHGTLAGDADPHLPHDAGHAAAAAAALRADGVDNYVDMAVAMRARLGDGWAVVGSQDMAALGRQAAPK